MGNVNDVIFEAQIKFDRSKSQLSGLQKELDDVRKKLKNAKEGSEDYIKAKFRLNEITKQLSNTLGTEAQRTDTLSGKLGKFKGVLAGAFAVGVLKNFAQAGFESATALENNTIAFETKIIKNK